MTQRIQSYHPTYERVFKLIPCTAPACTENTTKSWCLEDAEYPIKEIKDALNHHFKAVLNLYRDQDFDINDVVFSSEELAQETHLCPSSTTIVRPLRAINIDKQWRIIVNGIKAHDHTFNQYAQLVECNDSNGKSCPLLSSCYNSKCVQKSVFHRFLVYDPADTYFPFAIENIKLPASCSCLIKASFH